MQCASHTQRWEILGIGLRGPDRDLPRVTQLTGKGRRRPLKTCTDRYGTLCTPKEGKTLTLTDPFPSQHGGQEGAGAQPLTSCTLFDQVTSLSLSFLIWKLGWWYRPSNTCEDYVCRDHCTTAGGVGTQVMLVFWLPSDKDSLTFTLEPLSPIPLSLPFSAQTLVTLSNLCN